MEFTTKHDLPSGGWVELRNANYLRGKDRKAMIRKLNPTATAEDDRDALTRGFEALNILAGEMITAWELPYEPEPIDNGDGTTTAVPWKLPKDEPSLVDELMAADSVKLEELLAPARKVLMPQAPSPDQADDKESPSGPLSA